jgi:hypothetical protein
MVDAFCMDTGMFNGELRQTSSSGLQPALMRPSHDPHDHRHRYGLRAHQAGWVAEFTRAFG